MGLREGMREIEGSIVELIDDDDDDETELLLLLSFVIFACEAEAEIGDR